MTVDTINRLVFAKEFFKIIDIQGVGGIKIE